MAAGRYYSALRLISHQNIRRTIMNSKLTFVLLAAFTTQVLAFSVGRSGAHENKPQRFARATEEDNVVVILKTERKYESAKNEEYLKIVEKKFHDFAVKEELDLTAEGLLNKQPVNVDGKFGVQFTIEEVAEQCDQIKQFVNDAINDIKEIKEAVLSCGFDAPQIIKQQ